MLIRDSCESSPLHHYPSNPVALLAIRGTWGAFGVAGLNLHPIDGGVMNASTEAEEKTVFVRAYLRLRNGKWQEVSYHYRKPRRKRGQI
jgi:hypothetical protein